ncbi:hypothetical protein CEXT_373161 [Caerostris extrusa]|uniref:Uncharacterized protein n=1 Tax=Caerostris extrusa TaxID=172846 RepID=A0AAV4UBQ9_CAEEX|nr:hypothetical protein CEXT_373161 [Caerostris extrusa]
MTQEKRVRLRLQSRAEIRPARCTVGFAESLLFGDLNRIENLQRRALLELWRPPWESGLQKNMDSRNLDLDIIKCPSCAFCASKGNQRKACISKRQREDELLIRRKTQKNQNCLLGNHRIYTRKRRSRKNRRPF